MNYFGPSEASIPRIEEIEPVGSRWRVTLRMGHDRLVLHDVVDLPYAVGDEAPEWRRLRYRASTLRPAHDPWGGEDD